MESAPLATALGARHLARPAVGAVVLAPQLVLALALHYAPKEGPAPQAGVGAVVEVLLGGQLPAGVAGAG